MATTLRIEHLVKRFEGLVAVNDLSIDVQERKIHALIGPNGSGKTTTLNLINSVIPPTSGQISRRASAERSRISNCFPP